MCSHSPPIGKAAPSLQLAEWMGMCCQPQLCPSVAGGSQEFRAENASPRPWGFPAPVALRTERSSVSQAPQRFMLCCCLDLSDWRALPLVFMFRCAACCRCLTMPLKRRKWSKNTNHWLLTFWSGSSKPLSSSTIANSPTRWLECNSSCRRSTLTAQWRNRPSNFRLSLKQHWSCFV